MARANSSEALGIIVFIFLVFIFLMFLSQSDTRGVMMDHLKYGDSKANEMHKSVGTCTMCGKSNVSLTDGKCTNCLFKK